MGGSIGWRDLEALSRAVLAVTGQTSTREVLQMIVESARDLLDAEYAALGVPDDDGRFADFYAAGISDEQWKAIGPVPRTHGMLGEMLISYRPQRYDDVRRHPDFAGWPSAHPLMKSFLGAPIVDGSEILGAVYLANKRGGGSFTDEDENLLEIMAAHAALALSRARMLERYRELTLLEERSRVARELHDAVAQKLFSLRLTIGAVEALVRQDPERAGGELGQAKALAAAALEELRGVVTELRPPALREDGLVAALRKHVEVTDRAHPMPVEFRANCEHGCDRELPNAVEDAVFRVAQEALHNAVRHGSPSHVLVEVSLSAGQVRLEVSDDGVGFSDDPAAQGGQQLGIMSMRERARNACGQLTVDSFPGGGTTIRLEVPVG